MQQRLFSQVDVFTAVPYFGNPLAVVHDGAGLSEAQMQRFARWTNLSEATFLLPPTDARADYQLRIFTPGGELPFAGHPTLGSCHVWLSQGGQPKAEGTVVQQCAKGLIPIRRVGAGLAFAAPALSCSDMSPQALQQTLAALGLAPQHVRASQVLDNGPIWHGILVDSVAAVHNLQPDHAQLKALGVKVGVAACSADASANLHVRAFAMAIGVQEDPVTGSLNASLGQWLMAQGLMPQRYQALQGAALGRDGRVQVEQDATGQVWVGGDTVSCVQGQVWL